MLIAMTATMVSFMAIVHACSKKWKYAVYLFHPFIAGLVIAIQVLMATTESEDSIILLATRIQVADLVLLIASVSALSFEMNFWLSFSIELVTIMLCRIINITTIDRALAVQVIHSEIITFFVFLLVRTVISRRIFTTTFQNVVLKLDNRNLI